MKKTIVTLIFTAVLSSAAFAGIITEEHTYTVEGIEMKGFLAYDDSIEGKRPGVLVVHEWWGHNDYVRDRTEMLAGLGYTAFALDMYGSGKLAEHPDDAGAFAKEANEMMATTGRKRFEAALMFLKLQDTVDPSKVAAIGYCFGGATVLNMARIGVDITGVVSFHGSLATTMPARPGLVKAKVLVCHGAKDTFIPEEHIAHFKDEMLVAGVDYQFNSYEGAVHSFTNPGADAIGEKFQMPLAYNEQADQDSWADMLEFFDDIFE